MRASQAAGSEITGAAAIMVAVFMAFGLADVVLIKAIGIGLAIAVAIDATLVRVLIVPAVMRLLGDFNWWAPHPLRALHSWAGLGESAPRPIEEPARVIRQLSARVPVTHHPDPQNRRRRAKIGSTPPSDTDT